MGSKAELPQVDFSDPAETSSLAKDYRWPVAHHIQIPLLSVDWSDSKESMPLLQVAF
jgi:hypothetical protein